MNLLLCVLVLSLAETFGLDVHIDYSFYVPLEGFGVATLETVTCCPYAPFVDNNTDNNAVPTVYGIGVEKGGTTTLHEHITAHPNMHGAVTKETKDLDRYNVKPYKIYLQRWTYNRENRVEVNGTRIVPQPQNGALIDFTPGYIYTTECEVHCAAKGPVKRAHSGFYYESKVKEKETSVWLDWTHDTFWNVIKKGLLELEKEPECTFQTGQGKYTFNDCAGCLVRWDDFSGDCKRRPIVTKFEDKRFKCTYIGKELVLRGMYAAQLAWWFTLFDPSQFMIINSATFFEQTMETMKEIGEFLELDPIYSSEILQESPKKSNGLRYPEVNQGMVNRTKELLTEFYRRPNLELYRLLHETGHKGFAPFEKELQILDSLDCRDDDIRASGVCGDPRFYRMTESLEGATLPRDVEIAIHEDSDTKETAENDKKSVDCPGPDQGGSISSGQISDGSFDSKLRVIVPCDCSSNNLFHGFWNKSLTTNGFMHYHLVVAFLWIGFLVLGFFLYRRFISRPL